MILLKPNDTGGRSPGERTSGRTGGHRRRGILPPLALAAAFLLCGSSASAQPAQARIGAFITQLGDFSVQQKTFSASFWVWTLMKPGEPSALDSLEFPNAVSVKIDEPARVETELGVWVQRRVVGTFRHEWDMRRFPFDRQHLTIALEEAVKDLKQLEYAPDERNSSIDQDVTIPGWKIGPATLERVVKRYNTTFGDPRLPAGSASSYTRAELAVDLERTDRSGFWKLTAAVFAAAAVALFSYFLHVGQTASLSPRFSMLAGSVFAGVISLRSASGELGAVSYLTLIDQVHLAVLLYILTAIVAGVFSWRHFGKFGDVDGIKRMDRWFAFVSTVALLALIGAMLVLAARAGESL